MNITDIDIIPQARFVIRRMGEEICRRLETLENTCKPNGRLGHRNGFLNIFQLCLAQFL